MKDNVWQYHGRSLFLQRPLRNKLQATEGYIDRSSFYAIVKS